MTTPSKDLPEEVEKAISDIMEQAQVFASCYSLVGGRFDDGSKMQQSREEETELRRMISNALAAKAGERA